MCRSQADGGQRCAAHTRAALAKAVAAAQTDPSLANLDAVESARAYYASTPAGARDLRGQLAALPAGDPARVDLDAALRRGVELRQRSRELAWLAKQPRETVKASLPPEPVTVQCVWGEEAVTPGVLNDAAVRAYSTGQCAAMAYALHQRTGWPIVAALADYDYRHDMDVVHQQTFTDPDDEYDREVFDDSVIHVLVQAPDGSLVDVRGEHDREGYEETLADANERWATVTVPPEWVREARSLPPQNHELAATFVPAVLESLDG